MEYKTSEKTREGNRRRNAKWKESNPEHVKELNRKKAMAYYSRNTDEVRAQMRARANARWAALSPDERKNLKLKECYGITLDDWKVMLEGQGNKCAACGVADPGKRGWQTDHCHTRKFVRGLLCTHCNTGIGLAKENLETLESWVRYLKTHNPE